jgi:nucleotide-binding universal stress UspA family protein
MAATAPAPIAFREILVASDFSDASDRAIEYAKAIARPYGSHMLLVHVSEEANPITTPEGEWFEEERVHDEERMETAGMALREEGFHAETVNLYGAFSNKILALLEQHDIDLIVAGSRGRRGLERVLFGSRAETVARKVERPVLLVGPHASPIGEPWPPTNILCATELFPDRLKGVTLASQLALSSHATLTVLTVKRPGRRYDQEVWEAFVSALNRAHPEAEIPPSQRRTVASGRGPAAEIVDEAREMRADLIVMGAGRSFEASTHTWDSTLSKVLREAPCPVLSVRE